MSQPYGPPHPVTGITLSFLVKLGISNLMKNLSAVHGLLHMDRHRQIDTYSKQ
jgi:cell division protein FtsW (lipid II flippase)